MLNLARILKFIDKVMGMSLLMVGIGVMTFLLILVVTNEWNTFMSFYMGLIAAIAGILINFLRDE